MLALDSCHALLELVRRRRQPSPNIAQITFAVSPLPCRPAGQPPRLQSQKSHAHKDEGARACARRAVLQKCASRNSARRPVLSPPASPGNPSPPPPPPFPRESL